MGLIIRIMDKYNLNKNTFNKLASQYQDRFMDYDGYLDTFDVFINTIDKEDAKILEIACGPGNVTKYLHSHRSDYNIYGIDVAPKMIDLARINNPTAKYDVMDCRFLSHVSDSFDAIMCAFGMPYITKEDTIKLINDSCNILEENGILYISTMEGNYEDSEYVKSSAYKESTFVYYHEVSYLKEALEINKMKVLHEIRQPYQNAEGKEFVDLFLIAKRLF